MSLESFKGLCGFAKQVPFGGANPAWEALLSTFPQRGRTKMACNLTETVLVW